MQKKPILKVAQMEVQDMVEVQSEREIPYLSMLPQQTQATMHQLIAFYLVSHVIGKNSKECADDSFILYTSETNIYKRTDYS
jgi:hypothetical protein